MRYALISDIHANAAALRATLADAADCGAEKIICLGDVLGYGPEPVETLEIVYRRVHVCLAGNHDDAVSGRSPFDDFTEFAAAAVKRHRALLAPGAVKWLQTLPYVWECRDFACTHGEFSNPRAFDYVLEPADAAASFAVRREKLLFVGHSHDPCIHVIGASGDIHRVEASDFQLESGKRYLVNPGSVGYPRVGICRSSYCIYDTRTRVVTFRSLPFDLDGYREKMDGRGLEEAPWMRGLARERATGPVRAGLSFAKKTGKPRRLLLPTLAAALAAALAALALVRRPSAPASREALPPAIAPGALGMASPLVSGWRYQLENPEEQRVSVESGNGVTFVRMESARELTTRFQKRIDFAGRAVKEVEFKVRTLGGAKCPMRVHLFFTRADESTFEDHLEDARKSKTKRYRVPAGAVSATLEIDFRFSGEIELELPRFAVH